ncbi:MAG: hypothetical protein Q9224_001371 [Gallowayella concinna]
MAKVPYQYSAELGLRFMLAGDLQLVDNGFEQSIGAAVFCRWPYANRMKHWTHGSVGRQTIVPIIGALAMTLFSVQLARKSFILRVVQQSAVGPVVDGLPQEPDEAIASLLPATTGFATGCDEGFGAAITTAAIGEAVHDGRNRKDELHSVMSDAEEENR